MNRFLLIIIASLTYSTVSIAACNSKYQTCEKTTLGLIELKDREDSGDDYSHILLNGREIYKAKADYMVIDTGGSDGVFKNKKYLITKATISYVSDDACYSNKIVGHCSMNVVLDLTSGKPVISNEFYADYGPSHITWVSWGKANSIIVIDDYLRFKYANGHVEQVTKVKDAAGTSSEGK
ncbi:hypothetical protein OH773_06905 [Buttiauxella sp. WJP83]|uniref:hypothetical protein n=1 Tax=Buttiauxella sp. WJP83 TaxID=2986951 RepID=UPI0022DD9ED2|nr:hypothetical protein [Buttiauxella sp. WJP83]WBM71964.1 hypothetical protein OH773_06905 [Buttiauxella sp. WJP83]